MTAGKRKHQIVIQQATTTNDSETNEPIQTWATWRTVQAGVEIRRGREFFENGQRFSETIGKFLCYHYDVDGITSTMRISFDGNLYDIKSIVTDYLRRRDTLIETNVIT
jgi:SPP1 family predicted phage head-tail adaptor